MERSHAFGPAAALFDLAMTIYAVDSATWTAFRYAQCYPALAIERLIEAMLDMMTPAMEDAPEPADPAISRERLLAGPAA